MRDLERRADREGRNGEDVVDLLRVLVELVRVSFLGSEIPVKFSENSGEDIERLDAGELVRG